MRLSRTATTAVGSLALLSLGLVTATPAAALESANGVRLYRAVQIPYGPFGENCTADTFTLTCYASYNDRFYVKDKKADGWSAASYFEVRGTGRSGACYNPYGEGSHSMCDLDFVAESATVCFWPASIDRDGRNVLVYNSSDGMRSCTEV